MTGDRRSAMVIARITLYVSLIGRALPIETTASARMISGNAIKTSMTR